MIPNFNGAGFIGAAIDAIEAQTRPPQRVLVVDNGSTDSSVDLLRGRGIDVLETGRNLGFGGAANVGLAQTDTPLVAIVNSDARPRPDWLAQLATGPAGPDIWAWGSVQISAADGSIESAGDLLSFSGVTVKWMRGESSADLPTEPYDILAPPGAAPLMRSDVVRTLGGWWERYFLYFEDIDLSLRARLAGFRAVMVPTAVVAHDLGRSGDVRRVRRLVARNGAWCMIRSNPAMTPGLLYAQARREFRDAWRKGYVGSWARGKLAAVPGLVPRLTERRAIMSAAVTTDWRPDGHGPPGFTRAC